MDDKFQAKVSERLQHYMNCGLEHDTVLKMIGRDFPCMDNEALDCCVNAAYQRYYSDKAGKGGAAHIKEVRLAHSNHVDGPFFSHVGYKFHVADGEDLMVAVMLENPFYLSKKANVHLTVHVNGNQVNEFKHIMSKEERRKVYYIPLNIEQIASLKEDGIHGITVEIIDENIEGRHHTMYPTIFRGEKDAADAFALTEASVYDSFDYERRTEFNISEIETVQFRVLLDYNGGYGYMTDLDGVVVLKSSDSKDRRFNLIRHIQISEEHVGSKTLIGQIELFNTLDIYQYNDSTPLYKVQPGKYTVEFYIWDTLLWSGEIEFEDSEFKASEPQVEQHFDFDAELDRILKDLELEYQSKTEAEPETEEDVKSEPELEPEEENPFDFIEVIGLNLYNVNSNRDDHEKCLASLSSLPQTSFAADKLKMLSVIGKFKKLQYSYLLTKYESFKWSIYDQTGRLVDTKIPCQETVQEELWICAAFGDFCSQQWTKGTYRIELQCLGTTVISAVFNVGDIDVTSDYDPKLITKRLSVIADTVAGNSLMRLEKMAGLKKVKEKIHSLMNFHKLQQQREAAGLPVKRPALHARFLGNPGTGKTTVARLLGQIYKEMGLLSSGHVVLEERKNMIGRYYDSEGQAVDNALNRAKGGILLIDEAYNLYVESDDKDPGRRILEYLLTALSDENNRDWMLILAGYPNEMKAMLESNPGIESRVNEVFEFEDLNVEELLEIAELYCDDNTYELSDEARERLKSVITRDLAAKDKNFGNGRYVKKLMETAINTNMATRLGGIECPTYDQLVTIEADDIPISQEDAERISSNGFDEAAIDEALKRLDSLVGLSKVKSAIHNFVNVSRYLQSQGERYRGKGLLKWNFTGNTGTGKSTVAQILADILKAMNLVQNSELTEVKGEEIFNVSDYECNEVIRGAVKRSRRGVLFIDGDAPEFRSSHYRLTSEQIRFKLAALASEDNASGALIISECSSSNLSIAHSLASNGIYDFDHTFIFDDYTDGELYDILLQCLDKHKTRVSDEAEIILREYVRNLCANRELSFANARTMKNLSRSIFETVILRLSKDPDPAAERLVLACDVESFVWKKISNKIGF